jgi:hypothetical protein
MLKVMRKIFAKLDIKPGLTASGMHPDSDLPWILVMMKWVITMQ